MIQNIMFIDAETDGLYGEFISVGIVVLNCEGEELVRHYLGRDLSEMVISNDWVKEHVIPNLGEYEKFEKKEEFLERIWHIWMRHSRETLVVSDVTFPVECRLWEACVRQNLESRAFEAPFPLLDLSSMLYAHGIDPLQAREELIEMEGEANQHNALYDAVIAARIWRKYILPTYQTRDN